MDVKYGTEPADLPLLERIRTLAADSRFSDEFIGMVVRHHFDALWERSHLMQESGS